MKKPLRVTFHDFPPSLVLEAIVRRKAEKLEAFHPEITSCHVAIERCSRRHATGNPHRVHVEATVPGGIVAVTRDAPDLSTKEAAYATVRDAFQALARRLRDEAWKRRGDVKSHEHA